MYKTTANAPRQLTFEDFNQTCGMQLSPSDEWCVLAGRIDWGSAEAMYIRSFKSLRHGHPAAPARQAIGALIIQKRMGLSDRALVKAIAENPYYQYFIGHPSPGSARSPTPPWPRSGGASRRRCWRPSTRPS